MDCKTIERYLDLYLDGELAQEERMEVEVHLFECESCRAFASSELRWRQRLRRAFVGSVKAPSSLRATLERRMAEADTREERQRTMSTLVYVGLVLVVAFASYSVMGTMFVDEAPEEAAVRVHSELTHQEVMGSSKEVLRFLKKNAPFDFKLPLKEGKDVKLVGARIAKVGSSQAIVYHYKIGERRVSVVQYPSDGDSSGWKVGHSEAGYTVVTFGDSRLVHTLVGDIPENEAHRIVKASW